MVAVVIVVEFLVVVCTLLAEGVLFVVNKIVVAVSAVVVKDATSVLVGENVVCWECALSEDFGLIELVESFEGSIVAWFFVVGDSWEYDVDEREVPGKFGDDPGRFGVVFFF